MERKKRDLSGVTGVFSAHGVSVAGFFICPRGLHIFVLAQKGKALTGIEVFPDIELYSTREMRSLLSGDLYQLLGPGQVFKNTNLEFRVVFPNSETCFTTGIVTHGRTLEETLPCSQFSSEQDMMRTLMAPHDDAIIPRDKLWGKEMTIGEMAKLITNVYDNATYIGMFCRTPISEDIGRTPKFLTVKMTDNVYSECFFTKLELLETCANDREFPGFSLVGLTESKLKMRVTFTELCAIIRMKLDINNTISSFEFHSVIEIFHAKRIPLECVMFALDIKLYSLVNRLETLELRNVVFAANVTNPSLLFVTGLRLLCIKFGANLDARIIANEQEIDQVISAAEKAISGMEITKKVHDYIVQLSKKYAELK